MQVVITMAGLGQRFKDQGFKDPKPFIKIKEKYILEYLIEQFSPDWKLFFVVNENLDQKYIFWLKEKYLNSQIIKIKYSNRGPIDTVLAAIPFLKTDESVSVSYCDYSLDWDVKNFEQKVLGYDAAVVGYTGFQSTFLGPNSYCHYLVKDQCVLELQEKKLYTKNLETEWTSCGLYYFKSVNFMKECLSEQLTQNLNYNGKEFYTSLAIQAILNKNPETKVLNYQIQNFFQFGTPFDIELYLKNHQ